MIRRCFRTTDQSRDGISWPRPDQSRSIAAFRQVSVQDSHQRTYDFQVHDWIHGQDEHDFKVENPLEGEGK